VIVPVIRSGATVIVRVFDDEPDPGDASEQGDNAASALSLSESPKNRTHIRKLWAVLDLNQ
jgi:hypothetical protein